MNFSTVFPNISDIAHECVLASKIFISSNCPSHWSNSLSLFPTISTKNQTAPPTDSALSLLSVDTGNLTRYSFSALHTALAANICDTRHNQCWRKRPQRQPLRPNLYPAQDIRHRLSLSTEHGSCWKSAITTSFPLFPTLSINFASLFPNDP